MSEPTLLTPEERVLPTLNDDGTRRWIDPKHASGRFNTARNVVGWGLIVLFVALPFVEVGGRPSMWLNLPRREFTFFGKVFLATDTDVLLLAMLSIFVAIFLLTALLGRAWCGWGCPQTVYMELVYRPVERFFRRFSKGYEKTWRQPAAQAGKLAVFTVISLVLAHTFLAYFVSVDELARWVQLSPAENPTPFLIMAGTAGLIMFDFTVFREQMCTVACPYARLQSVLLDKNSLIIGYDARRGERRGKGAVKEIRKRLPIVERCFGDCIDCGACAAACPTGIDIRDGLQLECIGCAQCVDACDRIMDKIGAPRGLVRYSSQASLEEGTATKLVRARTLIYPVVLTLLIGGLFVAISSHTGAEVKILSGSGAPLAELDGGIVANQVRVRIANRTGKTASYSLSLERMREGFSLVVPTKSLSVAPNATESGPVFIQAPKSAFADGDVMVNVVVSASDGWREVIPFKLLGPAR
ncbi:MAG: cytochrome c oxidase accessory protein CcoG [Myxococcota bacterium]